MPSTIAFRIARLLGVGLVSVVALGGLGMLGSCTTRRAPRPAPAGDPLETAPLTNTEIEAVIGSRMGELKSCFATLLVDARGPTGAVTLQWIVQGDGEVTDVAVVQSDFHGRDKALLMECLEPRVRDLPFPSTRGGRSLRITYPFVVKE